MNDAEILYDLEDIHNTLGSLNSRIGSLPPSVQPVSHIGTFPVSGNFYPPIQQISGTVQTTGVIIGTIHVINPTTQPVTGTVHVREVGTFIIRGSGSFWPAIQEISGTVQAHVLSGSLDVKNFPAIQAVSGTIAVKEIGTFIVRRSGTFWPPVQEISGTIQSHVLSGSLKIGNFPLVQEISGTLQSHVLSGTIHSVHVGTMPVSGFPSLQEISGTIQSHVLSGSISVKNFPTIQEISGSIQSHILSGSVNVQGIGTFCVRRSGSFWQSNQQIHGSVGIKNLPLNQQIHGSVSIYTGNIRVTSGSIDVRIKSGTVAAKEVGTFIVRRSGSFWQTIQEISGTIQSHVLSGSIDIRLSTLPVGAATETTLAKLPAQGTFDHGRKSGIGTIAVLIGTLSFTAKLGVIVKAANSNYGRLFVGNSDVTADSADLTDGFELGAGESLLVKVNKVNKVYVRSTGTAQKAFWMAV